MFCRSRTLVASRQTLTSEPVHLYWSFRRSPLHTGVSIAPLFMLNQGERDESCRPGPTDAADGGLWRPRVGRASHWRGARAERHGGERDVGRVGSDTQEGPLK